MIVSLQRGLASVLENISKAVCALKGQPVIAVGSAHGFWPRIDADPERVAHSTLSVRPFQGRIVLWRRVPWALPTAILCIH
jgi:hypothetical protein